MKANDRPLVVGITGNIGVGKSKFIELLAAKGAYVIDMDQTTRRALDSSGPGFAPVIQEFGRGILRETGEIDRSSLGRIVFGDSKQISCSGRNNAPYSV